MNEFSQRVGELLVVGLVLLSSCSHTRQETESNADMQAARASVDTFYQCIKIEEMSFCRRTLDDTGRKVFDESTVKQWHDEMESYEVVEVRKAEADPRFGIQEDDVEVFVRVNYRDADAQPAVISYLVRKQGSQWKIVDWVAQDKAEEPLDDLRVPPLP